MAHPELDALLTLLTRHGVSSCKLSDDGKPLELNFWAPGLVDPLGETSTAQTDDRPQSSATQAAQRLLSRGKNGANRSGN